MASNPNPALPNKNTCYLAASGFGKSQALRQNPAIPKGSARVLLWDIDHDHPAKHFDSRADFLEALLLFEKAGRGYRLAFSGDPSIVNFEWWCGVVWRVLDGRKKTHVLIEELADVSQTIGRASPRWGELIRRGRKYGMVLHWTSQRSAEVSKTAFTQCPIKYIGQPDEGADLKRMAEMAQVPDDKLQALNPLEFYIKETAKAARFKKFNYQKPTKKA